MLLFRNKTPVPLFLFRARTASNHKHDLFHSLHCSGLALGIDGGTGEAAWA